MSACAKCKRPIVKSQMPQRVEAREISGKVSFFADGTSDLPNLKEAKGRIKAIYHFRCYFQMRKHAGLDWYKYLDSSPTASEAQAQYKNRDDLVAERQDRLTRAQARLAELHERQARIADLSDLAEQRDAPIEILDLTTLIEEASTEAALAARQVEIAKEQAKEETPKGEADWRDPATLDI